MLTYKNLRFELGEKADGKPTCKAWRGKASKPYAFYQFRDEAQRAAWVEEQKAGADSAEKFKAERASTKATATEEMRETIQVGTILCYTWGWEQTNQDFLEVVEKTGKTVTVREIAAEMVANAGHSMSGWVGAKPGCYTGEPVKKVINAYGVAMPHGVACPIGPTEKKFCSWYA